MSFETALSKIGSEAKKVALDFFTKILPGAEKVAQEAEPLIDAAFPAIGPEFNIVLAAVAQAQASGELAAEGAVTGAAKMAAVIAAVTPKLLPTLTAQGLESSAAQAEIEKYAQAVVTVTNTFPVGAAPAA
jgi:hypothetical protein